MTPAEVKFNLYRKLVAMARGGLVPVVDDLHSLRVEGDTVHVGYDVVPGDQPLFLMLSVLPPWAATSCTTLVVGLRGRKMERFTELRCLPDSVPGQRAPLGRVSEVYIRPRGCFIWART